MYNIHFPPSPAIHMLILTKILCNNYTICQVFYVHNIVCCRFQLRRICQIKPMAFSDVILHLCLIDRSADCSYWVCVADGDIYTGTVADFSGMDPIIYRESLQTEQYDSMSLNGEYNDLLLYDHHHHYHHRERCMISFCCLFLDELNANTMTVVDIVDCRECYKPQGLRTDFSAFSSPHGCMNRA
jgi:hypothetical protein